MSERIPLVLLPGLLCDERLWRDQARDLGDIADPIIPDLTLDDTVSAMATRALGAAPEHFALAALSMGGYVAFEILIAAPVSGRRRQASACPSPSAAPRACRSGPD